MSEVINSDFESLKDDPTVFLSAARFEDYADFVWDDNFERVDALCCEAITERTISDFGCVYAWVLTHKETLRDEVVYIGYSDQNFHHRVSTWKSKLNAGLRARRAAALDTPLPDAKGSGERIGAHVRQILKDGHQIRFWARVSDRCTLWGEDVSIAKAEEDALLAIFRPRWNAEYGSDEREAI